MLRCPIRGHNHDLLFLASFFQKGTGDEAKAYECPTGRYRFTLMPYGPTLLRYTKPRWGWGRARWAPEHATAETARGEVT